MVKTLAFWWLIIQPVLSNATAVLTNPDNNKSMAKNTGNARWVNIILLTQKSDFVGAVC